MFRTRKALVVCLSTLLMLSATSCAKSSSSTASTDFVDALPSGAQSFTDKDVAGCQSFLDSPQTSIVKGAVDYDAEYSLESGPKWLSGLWEVMFQDLINVVTDLGSVDNSELVSRAKAIVEKNDEGLSTLSNATIVAEVKQAFDSMYLVFESLFDLCKNVYYRFGK